MSMLPQRTGPARWPPPRLYCEDRGQQGSEEGGAKAVVAVQFLCTMCKITTRQLTVGLQVSVQTHESR